jgi:hypothetical protein
MKLMRTLLAGAVATGLVLAIAGPASAADDTQIVNAAKRDVTARIDGRLVALRALTLAINASRQITDAHKQTLTSLINADQTGLNALKTKVAGETTVAALRDDAQHMVDDYRVYLLVVPKVRIVIGADTAAAVSARLATIQTKLAAAVAKAKAAGVDTSAADASLEDMTAQLTAANTADANLADSALAIQAGPDEDAIKAALQPLRTGLQTGRQDLRKAVQDAKSVRDFLKSLVKPAPATSSAGAGS